MRLEILACALALLVAPVAAVHAGPAEQGAIATGCQSSTNWSDAACACVAERAGDLSLDQQKLLAATLNEQKAEAQQYTTKLTPQETMQAAMFMAQAGPACQ